MIDYPYTSPKQGLENMVLAGIRNIKIKPIKVPGDHSEAALSFSCPNICLAEGRRYTWSLRKLEGCVPPPRGKQDAGQLDR